MNPVFKTSIPFFKSWLLKPISSKGYLLVSFLMAKILFIVIFILNITSISDYFTQTYGQLYFCFPF